MSIEQHHEHPVAPAEVGASLARLMDGLTRTLLDLPDVELVAAMEPEVETQPETAVTYEPAIAEPFHERRHGSVLNELSFLDD